MAGFAEQLAPHSEQLDLCTYCPKMCRFACPVSEAEGRETVTPWGKMGAANQVRKGQAALDLDQAGLFYKCTGCLLCHAYCVHGNDVPTALGAAREAAVAGGVKPPTVESFEKRYRAFGNPFGRDLARALPEEEGASAGAAVLYFPSCTVRAEAPDVGRDTERVVKAASEMPVALRNFPEHCCGAPLLELGLRAAFDEVAEKNHRALLGADIVVLDSPRCTDLILREYLPRFPEITAEVLHVTSFMSSSLADKRFEIRPSPVGRIAYHDPCLLGRRLGEVDAPRQLLSAASGGPPIEFPWNREASRCCGAGGGLPQTSPATAEAAARTRLEEFDRTGAETLVTSSPECEAHLRSVDATKRIVNLATLLVRSGCF